MEDIEKITSIADFQFGRGAGRAIFSGEIEVAHSRKTGKIRYIYDGEALLATLRASNGYLSLTVEGARRMIKGMSAPKCWVIASDEASSFVRRGRSLFAKHVLDADDDIRPRDEVVIVDSRGNLLAVGKALLSGKEMKAFKSGVAVNVRKGLEEEKIKKGHI